MTTWMEWERGRGRGGGEREEEERERREGRGRGGGIRGIFYGKYIRMECIYIKEYNGKTKKINGNERKGVGLG